MTVRKSTPIDRILQALELGRQNPLTQVEKSERTLGRRHSHSLAAVKGQGHDHDIGGSVK